MKKYLYIILLSLNTFQLTSLQYFYVSIPKCGNFLLKKCLTLMTNKKIIPSNNRLFLNEKQIRESNNNIILDSHAFANLNNIALMKKNNLKGFFIYRDPRDQIISFIYYFYKIFQIQDVFNKNLKEFAKLNFDSFFFKVINDYDLFYKVWNIDHSKTPNQIGQSPKNKQTIQSIYNKYKKWLNHSSIYVTTFEKLVGPQGGGSIQAQLQEIKKIARHLNLTLSNEQAIKISEQLFGGTFTFREGKIGSWKKYFKEEHKKVFKRVAGQLLIDLGYEKDMNW